jgi:hypothetical protein
LIGLIVKKYSTGNKNKSIKYFAKYNEDIKRINIVSKEMNKAKRENIRLRKEIKELKKHQKSQN